MIIREVLDEERAGFDAVATHPMQSWAWGDFREKVETQVVRLGSFQKTTMLKSFQMTIHQVPKLGWSIGYFPKTGFPDDAQLYAIQTIARKYDLVFIKVEPNVYDRVGVESAQLKSAREYLTSNGFVPGRAQFTPYSFVLDISKSEDELLANFKPKTRYNLKVAQKHGVEVGVDNSPEAFEEYLKLWKETTTRQQFYAHTADYHRQMWQTLHPAGMAHLLKASYQGKTLGIWIIFMFGNILYYPYGASSREHREVMANNLLAFEAIRLGKANGCHTFDMWGSLGPDPNPKDPWYGFHRFKAGYGGELMEFVGSYDYVADPNRYKIFKQLDTWRWHYLRLRSKLPF